MVADKVIRPGPKPEMIRYEKANEAPTDSLNKEDRAAAGRMFIKFRQPLGIAQLDKRLGVPATGEYVIRFSARAIRRNSRYKDEDLRFNSEEPMRLSISIDSRELGATAHRIIGEYEIPDDRIIEIEHRVWLEKGFTFHVHWANGPNGSFKRILRKVLPRYNKDALYPARNPPEMYIGSGPELHVYTLGIEGPFYEEWPPPGFDRFFPVPTGRLDKQYLRDSLTRLANAAFRRPVTKDEIQPYLDLTEQYLESKKTFGRLRATEYEPSSTSPRFIYLVENAPHPAGQWLDGYELASRLSYFLWSSMPDEELRAAAASGRLGTPDGLRAEVERMLKILEHPPSAKTLPSNGYTFENSARCLQIQKRIVPITKMIETAMRDETRLYFQHVLDHNHSLLQFIDSDYTFLNSALARHYGIPGVSHTEFQRVQLKPEYNRGGLLGQGSILTATSNGVETQPVLRGVWILENLLGTPPSPPPPDIEPIEPDTRGATIRELMVKHRENATCFECHRKIDPLGLSLETYDFLGRWRENYSKSSQ